LKLLKTKENTTKYIQLVATINRSESENLKHFYCSKIQRQTQATKGGGEAGNCSSVQ